MIQALGFLCLMFVLAKFAFGPIYNLLAQRQGTIQGNLDEAQRRRDEMVQLQTEYQQRLAQIEDEARDKVQAAVKEAQLARDEILAKAQIDREAIVARGAEEMQREREKAMATMRNEIAELAYQAANRAVRGNLQPGAQSQMIDEVIAGIGRNGTAIGSQN
ncbi:MAG TPA: F0F1 ATP synthase subunit B [Abditibacteriaceae bacterium]